MEAIRTKLLEKELETIRRRMEKMDRCNPDVSSQGVDWHLDHTLKVIISICKTLIASNPDDFKWKFNLSRFYIFSNNSIPRGRGKSPDFTVAKQAITRESLEQQLSEAEELLEQIIDLPAKSNMKHQYFGQFDLAMSQKFLSIHTNHHLKIIQDIIRR